MFDWKVQVSFEEGLKLGDTIEARWTNCYCYYQARAEIVRVNAKSVRVRLLEAVPAAWGPDGYPAGFEISIPRFNPLSPGRGRWSINNGVFPIDKSSPAS